MKLFSKLQVAGKKPDVLNYDLPEGLRVQIIQIWEKGFGVDEPWHPGPGMAYGEINRILCEEHQLFSLPAFSRRRLPLRGVIAEYFLNMDIEKALDVVQVVFSTMEKMLHRPVALMGCLEDPFSLSQFRVPEIIEELNRRFRENNVGYQYHQSQIIKLDGQFTHSEITTPALDVLSQKYLQGANQEFLAAYEHLRHGRFKECINECLKAFESTMKSICDKRGWPYDRNHDTASKLINICQTNGLFPTFMQTQLTAVRTALESGVPAARNRMSGHGQGSTPTTVTEDFARYVMNLTATNIRLLADSEAKLK